MEVLKFFFAINTGQWTHTLQQQKNNNKFLLPLGIGNNEKKIEYSLIELSWYVQH